MAPAKQVSLEVFPYLRVYSDGTIERYAGTEVTPPGLDPLTGVLSKDICITPTTSHANNQTTLSVRLYFLPDSITFNQKLPLLVYYHGGAFCIASPAEPKYHRCMNQLVSQAKILILSVDYRLAPEHPLPAAYNDSWAALQWVFSSGRNEPWLNDFADFHRVFLAGDSAGANITHHLALRVNDSGLKIKGIIMIHPYFWGKDPIGKERNDCVRKSMVDSWWMFVCPSNKGCDDPYINPLVDGAPSLKALGCDGILTFVAEKDILCDRGKAYHENMVNSGWKGKAEIVETKGEDHVFHIFNPDCDNAHLLIKRWASYINQK